MFERPQSALVLARASTVSDSATCETCWYSLLRFEYQPAVRHAWDQGELVSALCNPQITSLVRVDDAFERLRLGHVAIRGNGGGGYMAEVVDHLARRLRQFEIPLARQYSQGSLSILLSSGRAHGSTQHLTSRYFSFLERSLFHNTRRISRPPGPLYS
jgi:hypothetical protein